MNDNTPSCCWFEPFYQLMRQTLWVEQLLKRQPKVFEADDYIHVHVIPYGNVELLDKLYPCNVAHQMRIKRNIFCMTNACDMVSLTPADKTDMFLVDFDSKGQEKMVFIEFLFNDKSDNCFLYARNHNVSIPLSHAILSRRGIKYLAPEIVLLYKSTDTERKGYQLDYDLAMERMSPEQKEWLMVTLKTMNPAGHKWIMEGDR